MNLNVEQENKILYEHTPWFSWEEWEYVYKNVCSNNIEDLKEAYNQILVWKSRASRLSLGIESTIPLLQAYIARMDPQIESSFKNTILNMGVVRFLGIVTKGYVIHYKGDNTLRELALKMNIPLYIVNLRNDIVHGDSLYDSYPTMMLAIEVAFTWVKVNYWEEERKKMKSLLGLSQPVVNSGGNPKGKPKNNVKISKKNILVNELIPLFTDYIDELLISTRKFNSWAKDHDHLMIKKKKKLFGKLTTCLPDQSEDLVKLIVAKVFYSANIEKFIKKGKRPKVEKKECICKCPLPKCFVKKLSFILKFIRKNYLINLFLEELIKQEKDHELLYRLWFETIIGTAIPDAVELCPDHLLLGYEFKRLNEDIKWKRLLFLLLSSGNRWNCDIALRISTFDEASLNPGSRERLKKITEVYIGGRNSKNSDDRMKKVDTSEQIFSLDDVLEEAKKTTEEDFDYVEDMVSFIRGSRVRTTLRKRPRSLKSDMVLGVLPHQINDPSFFLQLLLPPSKSPETELKKPLDSSGVKSHKEQQADFSLPKRCKTTHSVPVTENCGQV